MNIYRIIVYMSTYVCLLIVLFVYVLFIVLVNCLLNAFVICLGALW